MTGISLILYFFIVAGGYVVLSIDPYFYFPYFIFSSLFASFVINYFALPKILRPYALKQEIFHKKIISTFLSYMVIGAIIYALF